LSVAEDQAIRLPSSHSSEQQAKETSSESLQSRTVDSNVTKHNMSAPAMTSAELENRIRAELLDRNGPLMGGDTLRVALGFGSMAALRQALSRNRLSIHVFTPPMRRGKFALTADVAHWLASQARVGEYLTANDAAKIPRKKGAAHGKL
jgi:hypothetical protein